MYKNEDKQTCKDEVQKRVDDNTKKSVMSTDITLF